MPPKRQRRQVDDRGVPDISDDAAERKRVLNVLAQRRYRKRKREHIAALEARVQDKNAPLAQEAALVDLAPTEECSENPQHFEMFSSSTEGENGVEATPPASPGTVQRIQDAIFDTLNSVDSSGSEAGFFGQSEMQYLVPSLTFDSSSSSSNSSPPSTTMPLSPPNVFESLFPLTPPSPETSALSFQFLENLNQQNITPNDLSATLQTYQTATFTFPDESTLEIPTLSLLRAILTVADRMHLRERVWAMDATSPFYTGPAGLGKSSNAGSQASPFFSSDGLPILLENLPAHLHPTPTQRLIPHHPVLDLFPWPTTRDKLIQVFSMPAELRPASASHPMALVNLIYDVEDPTEGMRVSGVDPFRPDMWEVGQVLFERWWWAFESRVIDGSNRLRRNRGKQGLMLAGAS
ncbi:hypothetical protein FQN51_002163 [Onygenales sp. PD_10]|nr:hypothetical protein FQN51_002163 [Onygenales sp. PD_10]